MNGTQIERVLTRIVRIFADWNYKKISRKARKEYKERKTIKLFEKAPFLSYGHPSPRGGKIATAAISVSCPLWGTRSAAESRKAQVGR